MSYEPLWFEQVDHSTLTHLVGLRDPCVLATAQPLCWASAASCVPSCVLRCCAAQACAGSPYSISNSRVGQGTAQALALTFWYLRTDHLPSLPPLIFVLAAGAAWVCVEVEWGLLEAQAGQGLGHVP